MGDIKNRSVICMFVIVLNFAVQAGYADPAADDRLFGLPDGQRINEDVQLVLKIPYEVVLYDESHHIYLGVKNRSDEVLRLQWGGDDWEQLLFQARSEAAEDNLTAPKFIPEWSRVESIINEHMDRLEIKQNEHRIYMRHRIELNANYDILPPGTREIRIGLLTGPEEWAFSDWVPIRRLDDRRLVEEEVIYEYEWHNITFRVRKVEIEGEVYLFRHYTRLAKLPEGATPRFEFYIEEKTKIPILKTYFDGVDVPPQITRVQAILEREWTPEIAPHATMLEELRAQMRGERETPEEDAPAQQHLPEPDPVTAPPTDEVPPEPEAIEDTASPAAPPQSTEDTAPESATDPTPARTWPVLLVLLLIAGGTAFALKHKRQS
jgi:hypothetical protein